MAKIHNKKKRMPAILRREDEKKWISNTINKEETMKFLTPFNEKEMEAYTISKLITARGEDPNVPAIVKPFQYNNLDPLPTQKSLF